MVPFSWCRVFIVTAKLLQEVTFFIAFVFLVVGTLFLFLGLEEMYTTGSITESYEKILLGLIMFIPGSYHTFLAFMACRNVRGWDYD